MPGWSVATRPKHVTVLYLMHVETKMAYVIFANKLSKVPHSGTTNQLLPWMWQFEADIVLKPCLTNFVWSWLKGHMVSLGKCHIHAKYQETNYSNV